MAQKLTADCTAGTHFMLEFHMGLNFADNSIKINRDTEKGVESNK